MDAILVTAALAGFTAFLWCALYWWPQRRIWALARRMPGPRPYPLFGNTLHVLSNLNDLLADFMRMFEEFGPVVRLWFGTHLFVFLKDPDDLQRVLGDTKVMNRDWTVTKTIAFFFGDGLFTLRGDKWRVHRKLITPTFHFKILETFVEVFGRKSKILVEKLKEMEGKPFDVYKSISLCTLDAICETAIGTASNSQAVGESKFIECFDACLHSMRIRITHPWLINDFIYSISAEGRGTKPVIKTIHDFSEGVIVKKLDEYRRGIRSPGIITSSQKKITSFLDMLIEASETQGSILSPEEMRDEVSTMAAAGLETTATTMCFLLVLIALHPETEIHLELDEVFGSDNRPASCEDMQRMSVLDRYIKETETQMEVHVCYVQAKLRQELDEAQAKIHQELDEVFGSDNRPASCEDMQQLPVLENCIKETMRLFPVAPALPREIDDEVLLPSGYTLPAGCSVMVLSYATHRDPRYFPEPLKFWPDRWLPEHAANIHPYSYIPFSAGPRNCVGQKYAQLQMKNILSQVLRIYKVTTPLTMDVLDKLSLSMTITLDRKHGERFMIQLDRRDK